MPEQRLQRCRDAYPGGDSVADAFRGRWCDDCQKRVAMVVPDDNDGFRPFDGEHDVIAFCKHCHGWLGAYYHFEKAIDHTASAAYRITQAQLAAEQRDDERV